MGRTKNAKQIEVVKAALDAFWASVAAAYPTATTGDLAPDADARLRSVAAAAVKEWVAANVPPTKVTIELEIDGDDGGAIHGVVNRVLDNGDLQHAICDYAKDNDVYLFIASAVVK